MYISSGAAWLVTGAQFYSILLILHFDMYVLVYCFVDCHIIYCSVAVVVGTLAQERFTAGDIKYI